MADTPGFAAIPRIGGAVLTASDASRTAPATFQTAFVAGPNGSRIERIKFTGLAATTQTVSRVFLYDPSGGGHWYLYDEVSIGPVAAPGATQPVISTTREAVTTPAIMPLVLPPAWEIRCTLNDAQTGVGVIVVGGDF